MFVVEALIAVAIAMTTAFGSLVADDIITADSSCTVSAIPDLWSHHCTSQARLGWFVGSALALLAALGLRHWMIHHNGTLYYIRLLPAESADRTRAAVDLARARSLDFRTATGWFGTSGDVVDLRADAGRVSAELERAMNDDDEATGYLLAPNLVFPAALAVGYDVLLRQRTYLAELPEQARRIRLPGGDTGMRTVFFDDGYDEWSARDWIVHHEQPDPEITLTIVGTPPVAPAEIRTVWLSLQLGAAGPLDEVDAGHPLRDACDVVMVAGPVEQVDGEVRLRHWELPTRRWVPGTSHRRMDAGAFARTVEELSAALEHVLDTFPGAHVLLSADLPRTVAFALGYVISERKDSRSHVPGGGASSLGGFWDSVTPVLIHEGRAIPALTHPAQDPSTVGALRVR